MSKKIQEVIKEKSFSLEMILEKANNLKKLQVQTLAVLPQELRAHIVVGQYTGHTLVLVADSPTWATKCRFMAPQLLSSLRKIEWLSTLQEVKVKTGFMETPIIPSAPEVIQKDSTPPDEKTRRQFEQMAAEETNPKLKKVLLRLAKSRPDNS